MRSAGECGAYRVMNLSPKPSPLSAKTSGVRSTVVFDDPNSIRQDAGAKTLSFFRQSLPVRIDQDVIAQLKRLAVSRGNQNVRLCLHDSPQAPFHDMIILEHPGKYYRPHKHLTKGESYHIIEGAMGVCVFDEQGQVTDACLLTPEGTLVYRVGVNMYHAVLPLTERVIYHESKSGPFLGETDSLYPDWAPDGHDAQAVTEHVTRLRRALGLPQPSADTSAAPTNNQ